MKTRALIAAFAFSAIVLGSGISALAYNGPLDNANHAGKPTLSPEKREAYEAMMRDFHNRVSPIYNTMRGKSLELKALARNPNTSPEALSKLAKEVAELRSQLRAERMAFGGKIKKELGVRPGYAMMGKGQRAGMGSLSPEKQTAYEAMMKDFFNRVSPMRDTMSAKRLELNALSRNPNVKPETLSKLANEVTELRSQLRAERMAFGDKMKQELGVRPGYGMMGNGMRGHDGGRLGGHGGYGSNCDC